MNYISDVLRQYSAQLENKRDAMRAQLVADGHSLPTEFSDLRTLDSYYGRLFAGAGNADNSVVAAVSLNVDNFGPMVGTDQFILNAASVRPLVDVARELPRWWETRVQQIFNDLQGVDESTDQTYVEEIFSRVRLGQESLESVTPAIIASFINGYLWSLAEPVMKEETQRFERDYDPSNPGVIPERSVSDILGRLMGKTSEVVDRLLLPLNEQTIQNNLTKFGRGLSEPVAPNALLAGQDIVGLGNDGLMAPEVERLLEWCGNVDKTDLKKVATGLSDYLYKEDENGEFAIQSLMDELIGTKGNSDQYTLYQKKCADMVFRFVFDHLRGAAPSEKETKQRESALVAEHKKQANTSKREVIGLVGIIKDFTSRLDMVKGSTEGKEFNEAAQRETEALYGKGGRRVSTAEKIKLKDSLLDLGRHVASRMDGASLTLRGIIQRLTDKLTEWVTSKFSAKASAAPVSKAGSPDSTGTGASRATDASTKTTASQEHVERGVKRLGEKLGEDFAPVPKAPKHTPRAH